MREEPTKLSFFSGKSSVGTTGINNGFQPGAKRNMKQLISFVKNEFRRNDRY